MAVPLFSAKPFTYFRILSKLAWLGSAIRIPHVQLQGDVRLGKGSLSRGHSLQAKLCPLQSTTSEKRCPSMTSGRSRQQLLDRLAVQLGLESAIALINALGEQVSRHDAADGILV